MAGLCGGGRLTALEAELQAVGSAVDTTVASLHDRWSGLAVVRRAELADLRAAVDALRALGETAAHNYDAAAAANTELWRQLL